MYLYDAYSMWRFTLLWTLIDVIGVHLITAAYAMLIQWRRWKFIWLTPVLFGLIGGLEAAIAGNVVGGLCVCQSGFLDSTDAQQARRCLHGGLLQNVYMDSIHMGHCEHTDPDPFILCNPRRIVSRPSRSDNCIHDPSKSIAQVS